MKIGVELEFFICHKSDETFYMPDIISVSIQQTPYFPL